MYFLQIRPIDLKKHSATNALGFMNVIVLHNNHRPVSANHVAILSVMRLWSDFDMLQLHLYSCTHCPEDGHTSAPKSVRDN
jgi:hypothetical protein